MLKVLIKASLFALMTLPSQVFASGCSDYEAEAEAIEGVVPKFNQNGSLRSILMHGESSFLTNKRSLINAARTKAELQAKAAFASFLSESISASEKASSLLEQAEITDQTGNTEGKAVELTQIIATMQSNTAATMKGIVKLDECVNTDENYILVTLGWKPPQILPTNSSVDPDAKSENHQEQNQKEDGRENRASSTQDNSTEQNNVCVNGVKLETVSARGYGRNQNEAVHDGIRLAISQVFGETFSASVEISATTASLEVTDSQANTEGSAIEISAQRQQSASATSGVVQSYRIMSTTRSGQAFEVDVSVAMPTYCTTEPKSNKKKLVILKPAVIAQRSWTQFGDKLAESIQNELESLLNETNGLTVLSRTDNAAIKSELDNINLNEFQMSELVKKGNKLAADYIATIKFSEFKTTKKRFNVGGGKSVDLHITSAEAWIRIIDIVTSDLVMSIRVPLTSKSANPDNSVEAFSMTMAHNMASLVGERVGGGFNNYGQQLLAASASQVNTFSEAKKKLEDVKSKLEEKIKNDW